MRTKEEIKKYQAEWYQKNKKKHDARSKINKRNWRNTKKGWLLSKYTDIKQRCTQENGHKAHLYYGLDVMSKEEFLDWALNSVEFNHMYDEWIDSNKDRKLCPTPDRFDSSLGYTIDNLEWITHSENSRRGAESRWGLV